MMHKLKETNMIEHLFLLQPSLHRVVSICPVKTFRVKAHSYAAVITVAAVNTCRSTCLSVCLQALALTLKIHTLRRGVIDICDHKKATLFLFFLEL